nr:unnamed protein product [Digitaria exilis]
MSLSTLMDMRPLESAILFNLALTICFCSYVVGLGPIPYILCSEMFPTKAPYCFPVMLSTIGLGGACGIYALVCCIPLVLYYYRIPETRMLSLELIADLFRVERQRYVQ